MLLAAATPGIDTRLVEAGAEWRTDGVPDSLDAPVVWGNVPAAGSSSSAVVWWAMRRERSLRFLGRRHSSSVRRVHRLPPAVLHRRVPPIVRRALLGGLLVELAIEPQIRVVDRILEEAQAVSVGEPLLRPSRDGSVLVTVRAYDGTPLELRAAASDGRKDPARNADALEALAASRVTHVPRLVGRGVTAGVSWTTETRLHGRLVREPVRRLRRSAAEFCATLPRSDEATALRDRMLALAERYPRWSSLARQVAGHATGIPGVMQHGDFWMGNLLTDGGDLVGVIDWDTWHPAGIPGVDLLQLEAMERRRRTGDDIGALWAGQPWRSSAFLETAEPYWRTMGIAVTPAFLELLSLDWWSGQLFKRQSFAARPGWIEANVDQVMETLGGHR